MILNLLCLFCRSIAIAVALAGAAPPAIGARAAPNIRVLDTAKAIARNGARKASRIALVIGNGNYPDADAPLIQPINDARALTASLRHNGFDVDVLENASKAEMRRAIDCLRSKVGSESVVVLFFGGYGIQAGGESYMVPVDAAIWKESDVRLEGVSIESVLDVMKGAHARLLVVDASRRNPYERRFRTFSRGLAPINATDNALILASAAPGKVADDSKDQLSVLMTELLNDLNFQAGIEAIFNKTCAAVSRASNGEQVPSVSSSLSADVQLGIGAQPDKAF